MKLSSTLTILSFRCSSFIGISDLYIIARFCICICQILFYLMAENIKNLANIIIVLSTAFQKLYVVFFSKGLTLYFRYLPLRIRNIRFIAYNYLRNVVRLAFINLLDPIFQAVKRFTIVDCINQNNTRSAFIISLCNGFKSFLACSIPNLHFYLYTFNWNGFNFKVDSDCSDVSHFVLFINVSQKDICLTNCAIANNHHLY